MHACVSVCMEGRRQLRIASVLGTQAIRLWGRDLSAELSHRLLRHA